MEDRQRHLAQLARVLPRAESLFAAPRQRLDQAGDKLGQALAPQPAGASRANSRKAAAQLRGPHAEGPHDGVRRAAARRWATRADAGADAHGWRRRGGNWMGWRGCWTAFPIKSVLERGFALVRGEDGKVRRRAAAMKPGEALTLTFADGETPAVAARAATARAQGKKAAPIRARFSDSELGTMSAMNVMERDQGEARLHYLDGEYEVVTPGGYVVCAVTGTHIPLDALRYWSVDLQEAYASPDIATARAQEKGLVPK